MGFCKYYYIINRQLDLQEGPEVEFDVMFNGKLVSNGNVVNTTENAPILTPTEYRHDVFYSVSLYSLGAENDEKLMWFDFNYQNGKKIGSTSLLFSPSLRHVINYYFIAYSHTNKITSLEGHNLRTGAGFTDFEERWGLTATTFLRLWVNDTWE